MFLLLSFYEIQQNLTSQGGSPPYTEMCGSSGMFFYERFRFGPVGYIYDGAHEGVPILFIGRMLHAQHKKYLSTFFGYYRKGILRLCLFIEGGKVTHVVAKRCFNLSGLLQGLTATDQKPDLPTVSRADENTGEPFREYVFD